MEQHCSRSNYQVASAVSHLGDDEYNVINSHCPISKLVREMVEKTELSEICLEQMSESFDSAIARSVLSKQGTVMKLESDIPVRRSNRIRRAVVKKDEIVTSHISRKGSKSKKSSDSANTKTESESQISFENYMTEKLHRERTKVPRVNKKDTQTPKQKVKKKSSLKKRNESIEDCIKSELGKDAQSQSLDSVVSQILDNAGISSADKYSNIHKMSDDQSSETSEKSVESCNNKPVKVKSRWWRSSELEAVMSSESFNLETAFVQESKMVTELFDSESSLTESTHKDKILSENGENYISAFTQKHNILLETVNLENLNLESIQEHKILSESLNSEVLLSVSAQKMSEFVLAENAENSFSKSTERGSLPILIENATKTGEDLEVSNSENDKKSYSKSSEVSALPHYEHIEENIYRFSRRKCKSKKQVRRMICDCTLTKEELEYGMMGCKEECLNRLLMIECGSRCPIGETCSNKKFQKKEYAKAEIFKTEKKGWGLQILEDISTGDFVLEFVGEVLNHKEYRHRVKLYAKEKNVHSYFMVLKTDEILDATIKGNLSRFINHSCNPNCETQKWTVNGELRVGVFAKRNVSVGEELTLDYQFQRYGREAQKCYCSSDNCSGYIGGAKQISIDAYGSGIKAFTSRNKRKGSEDNKKRDMEDMILEEEIEKLNGSRGLRNREDTLKLARLMVRADNSPTRHQLLDIITKTEEQACLRLFLDYHGLPLLWSWMVDVVDMELKTKILQVLSLLPITNKTMLLDSKVMSIVEKWQVECVQNPLSKIKNASEKSSIIGGVGVDSMCRKLKLTDFSDSETDSTSSHAVVETYEVACEGSRNTADTSPSEVLKDESSDTACEEPDKSFKQNIISLSSELISNWNNLKEVFRIPRLEQLKRKEDEMEVDNNAKKDGHQPQQQVQPVKKEISAYNNVSIKCGDQIQVVISGKNVISDHHRGYDYEQSEMKQNENPRRFGQFQSPSVLVKPRQVVKPIKTHYTSHLKMVEEVVLPKLNIKEESSPDILSPVPSTTPTPHLLPLPTAFHEPSQHSSLVYHEQQQLPHIGYPQTQQPLPVGYPQQPQPPILGYEPHHPPPLIYHEAQQPPPISYSEQHKPPLFSFPPPTGLPINTHIPPPIESPCLPPPVESSSTLIYPPPVMYPQSQVPFVNPTPPVLPPNPVTIPPPSTMPPQPPLAQQPPINTAVPPPMGTAQAPPPVSTANYMLPPTTPQPSVVPGTSQFVPNQMAPASNYPPTSSVYGNQSTPLYFVPTQAGLSNNPLPASFVDNSIPIQQQQQQSSSLLTLQPTPVSLPLTSNEDPPKPIKLPKNWRSATDAEGNVYYYHSVTRQTQWDPPSEDEVDSEDSSSSEESESSDTPTYDEPKFISLKRSKKKSKKRKKPTKAAADTSMAPVRPEIAKKIKELFRTKISSYIVHCLNTYRKPSCAVGRITSNEDFKYLARKLTHYTMTKELKQCRNVEDLDCNETVQHKAKDFIKKYMAKYGPQYSRKERNTASNSPSAT